MNNVRQLDMQLAYFNSAFFFFFFFFFAVHFFFSLMGVRKLQNSCRCLVKCAWRNANKATRWGIGNRSKGWSFVCRASSQLIAVSLLLSFFTSYLARFLFQNTTLAVNQTFHQFLSQRRYFFAHAFRLSPLYVHVSRYRPYSFLS